MDSWRVAVLGDGGVGKTALAVQVRLPSIAQTDFLTCLPSLLSIASLVSYRYYYPSPALTVPPLSPLSSPEQRSVISPAARFPLVHSFAPILRPMIQQ